MVRGYTVLGSSASELMLCVNNPKPLHTFVKSIRQRVLSSK